MVKVVTNAAPSQPPPTTSPTIMLIPPSLQPHGGQNSIAGNLNVGASRSDQGG